MTLYRINFTAHGDPAQTWEGYTSPSEARAAVREADSIIPIHWDYQIEEYQA